MEYRILAMENENKNPNDSIKLIQAINFGPTNNEIGRIKKVRAMVVWRRVISTIKINARIILLI